MTVTGGAGNPNPKTYYMRKSGGRVIQKMALPFLLLLSDGNQ
jgi:predicted alpha/beta-fold hydrolase